MTQIDLSPSAATARPLLSVVAPVYNEEEALPELYRRLRLVLDRLGEPWELILSDAGSRDRSAQVIAGLAEVDARVRGVGLARGAGLPAALAAGLEQAGGAAVVLIDAGLQDPPEVIPALVEQWRAGHDLVYGVRAGRAGALRRLVGRLTGAAPGGACEFRLISRRALLGAGGLSQVGVLYQRQARYAGAARALV